MKSIFQTVAFRLTLRYAVLFALFSAIAFGFVYYLLVRHLSSRTDEDLHESIEEFTTLYHDGTELDSLRAEFQRESESKGVGKVFFRLVSQDGDLLASSLLRSWSELSHPQTLFNESSDRVTFYTIHQDVRPHSVRVASVRLPNATVLEVGQSLKDNEKLLERSREAIGGALAAMIAGGTLIGWLLVRQAMAGVERVTQTANQIGQGDLSRRVPLGHEGAEIEQLAHAFNGMLERIEALVREMEDVTTNIAHDLRSPLTRIRGMAETTMIGRADDESYREMAGTVVEECDRLVGLINTMLEIAQADSGMISLERSEVNLSQLLTSACDLFGPLAQEKKIQLTLHLDSQDVYVTGDLTRLQRAVANILDNALKFTASGGEVKVSLTTDDDRKTARITVQDTGPGIPKEDLPHIFERFYRADPSRTTPGNGLGLPLARSIAQLHGGELQVTSHLGEGSCFTLIVRICGFF